jgi:LCP family protein required for cell wall assembly
MRFSAFRSFLRRRWRWILGSVAVVVACSVAAALLVGYTKYHKIVSEIHHVTVSDLGKRPPVYSTSSENILIFGSDSRAGLDHHEQVLLHTGSNQGEDNTDTIIVLHISPGRHLVTAMSIPRDTVVPAYQCNAGPGYPGQAANPYANERINAVFQAGGASCLWKTVEQQTGIHIDHFIEIGLAGFVNVINDLGGVNVCVPFNVNDTVSGLTLHEGERHIDGVTALAFWRTRENLGEGSDLQRIQRDQFMSAQVVKGVLATGLLSNPIRLLGVAGDLAPYLTIDSKLSISGLVSIGESLHGLAAKDVQFVTAPVVAWPADPNEVEFTQPAASAMFAAIAHDVSIPKGATSSASATPPGLAGTPAATPGAATPSAGTQAKAATRVQDTPTATPSPTASAAGTATPTPTPSAIQSIVASNGGITGAAACSADAAAFQGPNSP